MGLAQLTVDDSIAETTDAVVVQDRCKTRRAAIDMVAVAKAEAKTIDQFATPGEVTLWNNIAQARYVFLTGLSYSLDLTSYTIDPTTKRPTFILDMNSLPHGPPKVHRAEHMPQPKPQVFYQYCFV